MSRWDSAAMVSKTSELFPEPETPVNTVRRRFGISTLRSLRLLTRAPCTRISSWASAACGAAFVLAVRTGAFRRTGRFWAEVIGGVYPIGPAGRRSGLGDAHEVARGIAERAVTGAPGLGDGLLEHLGPRGADLLEGG